MEVAVRVEVLAEVDQARDPGDGDLGRAAGAAVQQQPPVAGGGEIGDEPPRTPGRRVGDGDQVTGHRSAAGAVGAVRVRVVGDEHAVDGDLQGGGDRAGDPGAACPPVPLAGVFVVAVVEAGWVGGPVGVRAVYGTLGQSGDE